MGDREKERQKDAKHSVFHDCLYDCETEMICSLDRSIPFDCDDCEGMYAIHTILQFLKMRSTKYIYKPTIPYMCTV